MSEFILALGSDGKLDAKQFSELRDKLASDTKTALIASLPDEFFAKQVDAAFKSLTEPKRWPAEGDLRCSNCKRSGSYGRDKCPHVLVDGHSEIQTMLAEAMREAMKKRIAEFAEDWTKESFTSEVILTKLDAVVEAAAKAHAKEQGRKIVAQALSVFNAKLTTCYTCNQLARADQNCHSCGNWVS